MIMSDEFAPRSLMAVGISGAAESAPAGAVDISATARMEVATLVRVLFMMRLPSSFC
jgi:hypothetical protein